MYMLSATTAGDDCKFVSTVVLAKIVRPYTFSSILGITTAAAVSVERKVCWSHF